MHVTTGSLAQPGRATISPEEAFRLLGVGRTAGYAAIRRGDIPALRVGRKVLIPVARLERLLSGEQTTPADDRQTA